MHHECRIESRSLKATGAVSVRRVSSKSCDHAVRMSEALWCRRRRVEWSAFTKTLVVVEMGRLEHQELLQLVLDPAQP